jgi:hypothetical protein
LEDIKKCCTWLEFWATRLKKPSTLLEFFSQTRFFFEFGRYLKLINPNLQLNA